MNVLFLALSLVVTPAPEATLKGRPTTALEGRPTTEATLKGRPTTTLDGRPTGADTVTVTLVRWPFT
jgi:hypothetical protein